MAGGANQANFSDLFSSKGQFFNGAFRTDDAAVTIGGDIGDVCGLLIQQMSFQYSQQITRLYEIGSTAVYYIAGRAQGQLSISQIVGPSSLIVAFIRQFANVCRAADNRLELSGTLNCDDTGNAPSPSAAFRYIVSGCVITAISASVQAQNMVINQQLTMQFAALDLK